jgi:transposase
MQNDSILVQKSQQLQHQIDVLKNQLSATENQLAGANEVIVTRDETIVSYQQMIALLEEKIKLMTLRQFSAKSEANLLQQNLFDELDVADSDSEPQFDEDKIDITYTRTRKPKRKPLPKHLPRIDTVVDIDDADKVCACGCNKVHMGEKVSEQLDIVPAKVQVLRTIRPQYVCKSCDNDAISIAALQKRVLPKSMLSEGALAHILVAKYVDHMPLYRQSVYWSRQGIDLPRNTLCHSLMMLYDELEPMAQALQHACLQTRYLQADETVIQVLNEQDKTNQQKSYLWVYRGGAPPTPIIFFDYQPSRSEAHPKAILENYQGYLQTDAYGGYDWTEGKDTIIHLFCMAHARRPFAELVKVNQHQAPGVAHQALAFFGELYQVEREAKSLTADERYQLRQDNSKPILEKLFAYLEDIAPTVPPKGKLGQAIEYMLKRKAGFYIYLDDGNLSIDSNLIENTIRPVAIGRKNWLFLGSPKGAKAAALFFSLIQTAKANNIEPYHYLRALFEKLPFAKTNDDFASLLPHNIFQNKNADATAIAV